MADDEYIKRLVRWCLRGSYGPIHLVGFAGIASDTGLPWWVGLVLWWMFCMIVDVLVNMLDGSR